MYFRNMTNIGIICAFPVQSAPFREKISTTIGTSHLFNVCVSLMSKESEGENSYLNRAANGCYRLKFFRDVQNSRTNYMFIYYANNAAYRRLAESF